MTNAKELIEAVCIGSSENGEIDTEIADLDGANRSSVRIYWKETTLVDSTDRPDAAIE